MYRYLPVLLILLSEVSCSHITDYTPKAKQVVPQKAFMFSAGQVKLFDGPFKESQEAEGKYILSLDEDRLLAPFLIESGLTPKDSIYPGIETWVLPGVALSFYLSGASRMYAATGEQEYLDKINYALDELERCQKNTGGYLLGTRDGVKIFERLKKEGCFPGFGEWSNGHATPFYSLEKLMSGLRDVYRICHIPKALTIWKGIGSWLSDMMAHIPDTELHKIMKDEYGGMNWLLSDLYSDTNDKRFLEMSRRWQDSITVIPCINGVDPLTNVHANMQFPKFSGLAARYPYSGDKSDLSGARFFWERVVYHHSYVTGGNSESEYFSPADTMSDRLTPYTGENCNEYNMLRLTSLLFQIEPKAEYPDFQERVLYNHSLAAQNTADGRICYFLPMMSGAKKEYLTLYTNFACCVCSSMDHYTRHGEFIYAYDDSSLFVNLFIASEVYWKKKAVTVVQETKFPFADSTTLRINCDNVTKFELKIRNPFWLASPMVIAINGEQQNAVSSNGYVSINRTWHTGDKVSLKLPMRLRTESMSDDKNKIAFFYGPVLLAGSLNETESRALVANMLNPALLTEGKPVEQYLQPAGDSLQFICAVSKPNSIKLKPLFLLKKGYYTVYWQRMTGKEYTQRKDWLAGKMQDSSNVEKMTIDKVIAGDIVSEKSHQLSGKSEQGGWPDNLPVIGNATWRKLSDSTGFGYTMKVPETGRAVLQCKFMGREPYETWSFAIIAGTDTVLTKKRGKDDLSPVVPYTMNIPLPVSTTVHRSSIAINFVKIAGEGSMPRLMEMRVLINN